MDTRVGNGLETPCKLLRRLFYGHLCTFFGLSVAARSTLSHLSVEL